LANFSAETLLVERIEWYIQIAEMKKEKKKSQQRIILSGKVILQIERRKQILFKHIKTEGILYH